MKYILFVFVIFLSLTISSAQSNEAPLAFTPEELEKGDITKQQALFKTVEEMPRFPGCDDVLDDKERTTCSHTKFIEYIYSNLKYPKIARKNKTEGKVFAQFVVDRDGSIIDVKIVRDIGDGCGQAVKDIITSMNKNHKWSLESKKEKL